MKKIYLLSLLFALLSNVSGQRQVTNIHSNPGDKSSSPSGFVEYKQMLFFNARTETHGREIWVKAAHDEPAAQLKDIYTGKQGSLMNYLSEMAVILNGDMYFIATDEKSAGELWKTDGTEAGTVKVTDFLNHRISQLTLVGDEIYFLRRDDDLLQVWKSDGTAQGTVMVRGDLAIWNQPSYVGKCNNYFIFTFQPYGTNDSKVWQSDGTHEGTFALTDEIDGNGAGPTGTSDLTQYIELNNELYFVSRYYLHKTDGTLANTQELAYVHNASTRLIDYADVVKYNGKLYFSFFEADYNRLFIWESDGTDYGTRKVFDSYTNDYFVPSNLVGEEQSLVFTFGNDAGGTSLVKLNLDDLSWTYIDELCDIVEPPFIFIEHWDTYKISAFGDGKFLCGSYVAETDFKAWIYDFTGNTIQSLDALEGVTDIFEYNGLYYTSIFNNNIGYELWSTDGITANLSDNINTGKYGLSDQSLLALNNKLLFVADEGETGRELWGYDGSATSQIIDIYIGKNSSSPYNFEHINNEIYFTAFHPDYGLELWKTDGTTEGTLMVQDIMEGAASGYPRYLTEYNGVLYFIYYKDGHYHLCELNEGSVEFIYDLGVNMYNSPFSVSEMTASDDALYLAVEGSGHDLWTSDGTAAGTTKLMDLGRCSQLTPTGNNVFFAAASTYNGENKLYVSDGTSAGTVKLSDASNGAPTNPQNLTELGNRLYFTAVTAEHGRELWYTDGTVAGTSLLADLNAGTESAFRSGNLCALSGTLFFSCSDGTNGYELWKSDGTTAGTKMVKDIEDGSGSSSPSGLVAVNDLVYFSAYTSDAGYELWATDGTEEGTMLMADVWKGRESSTPTNIMTIGDEVFFIAETAQSGRQIWQVDYNVVSAIKKVDHKAGIIYPNPANGFITIKSNEPLTRIEIYDQHGRQVLASDKPTGRIDVAHLKSGLYLVKICTIEHCFMDKLIKQ
ncbi:T9SS type A sorting domain-containing protein [Carboxylicivirga mesophila]|uniref:T9SS type A sorting domain-containing protein n=1 Tax=Carboxylicivirga mesophila TaxID=1166478 RepID=A0ABS5KEI7_9BACT|nr:ELWxxDGT repeat protein [Carboxylicivirga mesophila]MBS2213463.1 T9SS type A sorting domain-containing protein [Carboxylicivirga mesophila]